MTLLDQLGRKNTEEHFYANVSLCIKYKVFKITADMLLHLSKTCKGKGQVSVCMMESS